MSNSLWVTVSYFFRKKVVVKTFRLIQESSFRDLVVVDGQNKIKTIKRSNIIHYQITNEKDEVIKVVDNRDE
jgi:hypothetical protein